MVRAWFFQAIRSFNLPPVRFCAARVVKNVIAIPALTTGGQHRVIAEDRFPNQGWSERGDALFQKNSAYYVVFHSFCLNFSREPVSITYFV
jgi:hypothetical protein